MTTLLLVVPLALATLPASGHAPLVTAAAPLHPTAARPLVVERLQPARWAAAGQPAQPGQAAQPPTPSPGATAPPAGGQPAPRPATPRRAPAPPVNTRLSIEVTVSNEAGEPAEGILISAQGPIFRAGRSDKDGKVSLGGVTPGTYRLRAEGEMFVTLEKEIAIKPGAPATVDFALAATPPSPAPPPPPPPPAAAPEPKISPGDPRVVSLTDLAERSLGGRDPVKTVPVACSGLNRSQLLLVRDAIQPTSRPDVDETLYLIAGEALLTIAGKDQTLAAGWFGLVPRGSTYQLTRRGRNPAILLSVVAGLPCDGGN